MHDKLEIFIMWPNSLSLLGCQGDAYDTLFVSDSFNSKYSVR